MLRIPRPRLLPLLVSLALLIAAGAGGFGLGRALPPEAPAVRAAVDREAGQALTAAATALAAQPGYSLDGTQSTDFSGPGVPQNQQETFHVDYLAPDQMNFVIRRPMTNSGTNEVRYFGFQTRISGEKFYTRGDLDPGWVPVQVPDVQGFDLDAAKGLPEFLRSAKQASLVERQATLDGSPAIKIQAVGDAHYYTGVIYWNFLSMTVYDVPFTIWLDPATQLPRRIDLHPRQWPPLDPGQVLLYHDTLLFTGFKAGDLPIPSPLGTPFPAIIEKPRGSSPPIDGPPADQITPDGSNPPSAMPIVTPSPLPSVSP